MKNLVPRLTFHTRCRFLFRHLIVLYHFNAFSHMLQNRIFDGLPMFERTDILVLVEPPNVD